MMNRRTALAVIASTGATAASGVVFAKEHHHLDGLKLLGGKIKENGKHKIHTAGKIDVFTEIKNGKVVGLSAPGMQVKKVRSKQKLARASSGLILANVEMAQVDVYYYGYWVYDPIVDYYYWFTSDVVIVDSTWVDYVG